MAIKETVHSIGELADKALDEKDINTLKQISEDCIHRIDSDEFNYLEKGILAYHGATACSNYIFINFNGTLCYSEEKNNEEDFELCLLLFRKSIEYFSAYREKLVHEQEASQDEELQYYKTYWLMVHTNYANLLHRCGRFIKALSFLKIGLSHNFPMAVGNFGGFLMDYASFDYDEGHQLVFANESYKLLIEALGYANMHDGARKHYINLIETLKNRYSLDFLEEPYQFKQFSMGDSNEESTYRFWCLKNTLFLNTLNDAFSNSASANDILHLPSIVTKIDEGPRFHGLFNQIKQEFVSARYMVYESVQNREPHFSDKDVFLVNTLDYPVYGLGVEKMKYSYRSLYSLFDRISFLVNDYFGLGIKEPDVSYRAIWKGRIERGKKSYDLKVDLKKYITKEGAFNLPLIGFYWLCKDIGKQKVKHHYLHPSIEHISKIRHHLEHRYLKVHDVMYTGSRDISDRNDDPLAFSITYNEFENAVIELLNYVREAIILLSLSIYVEEQIRLSSSDSDKMTMPMYMDRYDDEWKQIF